MTKLDSSELIDEINKLQTYDPDYVNCRMYKPAFYDGDYIKFDDIEDMIKDMISND